MLRTIIVDDEELSVKRLKHILSESDMIEICATFLNPVKAYEYVEKHPIQLAFVDISMPEINGMNLTSMLLEHDPFIDIVFVTGYDDYAVQAFEVSALDYLIKPVTDQRMSKTLDKIRQKHQHLIAESSNRHNDNLLTAQEVRILRLITEGLTNKEIAFQLDISAETVKSHIKNVYRKLKVSNRIQALKRAKELNILQ
ncbi:response regulator [Radiobacillus sp. PE A8.2]|uniref:response regulator n=1 Tax=Radiobacillus sp. PE A8.2 TaxID=3380349 RepID=UPI00388D2562